MGIGCNITMHFVILYGSSFDEEYIFSNLTFKISSVLLSSKVLRKLNGARIPL